MPPSAESVPPLFKGTSPSAEAFSRVTLGRMSPCFRADARLHSAQCNLTLGRMSLAGRLPRTARRLAGTAGWLVKPTSGEMTAPRGLDPDTATSVSDMPAALPDTPALAADSARKGCVVGPIFSAIRHYLAEGETWFLRIFTTFAPNEHIVIAPTKNVAATLVQPSDHPASLSPRTITFSAEGARHKPVVSRVYASYSPAFTQ